jgi:uracil-DNA glycosylase
MTKPNSQASALEEQRFRDIFRSIHAEHPNCLADEWLSTPCRLADGTAVNRPVAWSRRNGPWRSGDLLWVGAAPGNAGGKGNGVLGAHATRIPFGGDIAGANLEVLFSSIGVTRNDTFITATLNTLPEKGGGEPTAAEIAAPVGAYPSSLHSLRDVLVAVGPRLIVGLGNLGVRAVIAAAQLTGNEFRIPTQNRIERTGLRRNTWTAWPDVFPPSTEFLQRWTQAWNARPLPHIVWLTHPSAQNMSPYAGTETIFHTRMLEARETLRKAVRDVLAWELPDARAPNPATGIYALPEWTELVGPRHGALDALWRARGV